jgi:ribose transport system substrate-binding protein
MNDLATKGPAAKAALPATRAIDTGVDVIDKSNVAPFKTKLAELKK